MRHASQRVVRSDFLVRFKPFGGDRPDIVERIVEHRRLLTVIQDPDLKWYAAVSAGLAEILRDLLTASWHWELPTATHFLLDNCAACTAYVRLQLADPQKKGSVEIQVGCEA